MENEELGVGEGPAKVVSISLPEGTVRALRELAGRRARVPARHAGCPAVLRPTS